MDEDLRNCPDLADLSAFRDGECDAGESRRIEEHLAGCPGCRGALAALRAADVCLTDADPARDEILDVERFVQAVRTARRAESGDDGAARGGARRRRIVRVALLASAAVAAGWLLVVTLRPGVLPGDRDRDAGGRRDVAGDVADRGRPAPQEPVSPADAERFASREADPSRSGIRTLGRIDEGWPRRCREQAQRILEERGREFDGSAEAIAAAVGEIRPLGRFALPPVRDAVRDERTTVSRLGFEILLRLPFDTALDEMVAGAMRHGRMDALLDTLEELASPASVAWVAGLGREDATRRPRVVEVLAAIPGRDALDALVDLAEDGGGGRALDANAVAAIASREDSDSIRVLVDLYTSSGGDPVVELAIRSNPREATRLVRRLLQGPRSDDFESAVQLAGVLEDRGAVALLLDIVHDDRWSRSAIRSLLRIGDPGSLPEVLLRLDPSGENARSLASLARDAGPAALAGLAEHAIRKKGETGRSAAVLLGHAGPRAIPHLAKVLRSGNHQREVSDALARLDTEEARAALASALDDPIRGNRLLEELIDRGHGELAIALLRTLVEENGSARSRRALARLERGRGEARFASPE